MLTIDQIAALASAPIAPVYLCPVCKKHHPSESAAALCAASTEQPIAKVGDLVVLGNGFSWHDGLKDWVYDANGYPFHGNKTLRFWYVITAITQYPNRRDPGPEGDRSLHQLVYHMRTLGLFNGQEGGHSGWTRMRSHIPWTKGDRPPPQSVIDEAAKHVGKIFDNLL